MFKQVANEDVIERSVWERQPIEVGRKEADVAHAILPEALGSHPQRSTRHVERDEARLRVPQGKRYGLRCNSTSGLEDKLSSRETRIVMQQLPHRPSLIQ
jgi:hypothetical protein